MEIIKALTAFEALSQETRLETLRLLVKAGPRGLPAGVIAEQLGCRQNTLSSHLKVLHHAGLIEPEREGRSIYYSVSFGMVRSLIDFLMQDCCADDACAA
jgi:DNA-binding transcriptional ArsR family regulator